MRSLTGPLLAAVVLALPTRVHAQEPPAPPPADAPAGPDLVISLDVSSNATENSEVRAVLYEVARRHGYNAAGKIDVDTVAEQHSLMKAGSVTADPKELTDLRIALGVPVLVRVSKDSGDASGINARVTVVTKKGVQVEVVRIAGAGSSQPLEAVLDRMLPPVLPPPPKEEPRKVVPESAVGTITPAEAKPDTTLKPKEAWENRGGLRPMYGAVALGSTTRIANVPYSGSPPGGALQTGQANAWGFGGGFGVRAGLVYLPLPEPNLSTGGFVAFRMGLALDNDFFWVRRPTGYDFSGGGRTTTWGNQALWVASGQAQAGFAVAAGRFTSDTRWSGVLIGLAYAPALQFSMDMTKTSGDFRGNLAGAEVTVDITTLDADAGSEGQMQIRVSLWGLAPIDDSHPGLLSLGLGVIWY